MINDGIKVILGNGLSGKIFAFYNREYKIIGKSQPQAGNNIMQNMIFLHDCYYNRMFLQDLIDISKTNINYCFKNVDVLTFDNNKYITEISEETKQKILDKKLTSISGKKLIFKNSVFENKITLSEEKNNLLKIIEVNFDEILSALDKVISDQVIDDSFVTKIDVKDKKIITEKGEYKYSSCISTINLNIFAKLSEEDFGSLDTLETTIAEGIEEDFNIPKIPYETAIIYFPQDKYEFGKIIKRNGKCYAEITGISNNYKKFVVDKSARLVKKNIVNDIPGVMFVSRYACWDPNIRIQDVIRQSSNKVSMQNIWTSQKAFSCRFFNMDEDLNLIQRNVKECILLMQNECFDLLNCINWKINTSEKKIDIDKIKEEGIDVFKYLLTIWINLGLTYEDFLDAYNKKDIKLKEKFGEDKNLKI